MSYNSEIREIMLKCVPNTIILSKELHRNEFSHIPELAFYKTLERMNSKHEISRLSKGVYFVPKASKYGLLTPNQNEISSYFTGVNNKKGLSIGYSLYNKYGLTTQIGSSIELYSNIIQEERKSINSVRVYKLALKLNPAKVNLIEILEILENFAKIEDLNRVSFVRYITSAIKQYEDNEAIEILHRMKYKKSTIAFLATILRFNGVKNSLGNFLSATSLYKIPKIQDIYEPAH